MSFELRDHTADVAIAATGETVDEVFAAVADGLAAAMCDEIPDREACHGGDDRTGDGDDGGGIDGRFSLSIAAESREALLYDYLADLIYERDVRSVLPVDNEVSVRKPATGDRTDRADAAERERTESRGTRSEPSADEPTDGDSVADSWYLDASAQGIPLSAIDAREVKAVTYSEMALEETSEGWRAYVVFDV